MVIYLSVYCLPPPLEYKLQEGGALGSLPCNAVPGTARMLRKYPLDEPLGKAHFSVSFLLR